MKDEAKFCTKCGFRVVADVTPPIIQQPVNTRPNIAPPQPIQQAQPQICTKPQRQPIQQGKASVRATTATTTNCGRTTKHDKRLNENI